MTIRALSCLGLVWLAPTVAFAATYEVSPGEDVEAAINMLQPGDELILHDGMWEITDRFSVNIAGTEADPILIRAADDERPHIHRPNASENLIDFDNVEWVEFRGIEFSGGSAGLRLSGARNLTIRDCEIHSTNDVALRANDGGAVYENLHIVGNHIHDTDNTGEGMYLGCNSDGCQMMNSIIERNYIHHTNQPSVEQGDGIEIKEGSAGNIVRDNVIHDTNYPCILTYSTVGNGEPNIIEGNVMWNCGDHGMQVAADAIIRNNIVLSAAADGIAMQPHQSGAPANLEVVNNTVLIPSGDAISVSGAVGSVLLANNAAYTMSGSAISVGGDMSGYTIAGNVGMGGLSGAGAGYVDGNADTDFVAGMWSGAPPNDVFPAMGGALVGAGDPAYASEFDFNTLNHNTPPDVGAYAYDPEGNPGWTLQADFKGFPDDVPGETDSDTNGTETDGDSDTNGTTATNGGSDDETNGGDTDGDSDSDTNAGETDGPSTVGETDGASTGSENEGGDEGCGCQSSAPPPALGYVVLLGLLGLRRRN